MHARDVEIKQFRGLASANWQVRLARGGKCQFQLLMLLAVTQAAPAQTVEQPEKALPSVVVAAVRNPEMIEYKKLKLAEKAFEANHELAPGAALRFMLKAREQNASMEGVELQLASDDDVVPVPLAPDLTFSMPHHANPTANEGELVINRKKGSIGWLPYVRSPGVKEATLRLGDLRLACEIDWAVNSEEISFVLRSAIRMAGGPCKEKHFIYHLEQKIASIQISAGERSATLPLGAKNSFYAPLGQRDWPNESIITVISQ